MAFPPHPTDIHSTLAAARSGGPEGVARLIGNGTIDLGCLTLRELDAALPHLPQGEVKDRVTGTLAARRRR